MFLNEYGEFGEAFACKCLKKLGYKILTKNFIGKTGEIDIIAIETKRARKKSGEFHKMSKPIQNEDVLCFIEVKSRKSLEYGNPSDAVDYSKQRKYYSLSYEFMKKNNLKDYQHRFDIIEVLGKNEINHIKNAF